MQDNQTTLAKLIELRDKQTPEQRKAFLEAEQRYMAEQERLADSYADWAVTMYIAQRYMK
jgi:hypothetical protein